MKNSIIYILLFAVPLLLMQSHVQKVTTVKGNWDISSDVAAYSEFLSETPDFDYSSPNIQSKAKEIKASTSSPKEAVKATIKYVASTIKYNPSVSISYCYSETASKVMEAMSGDCVSMSRLVTALLRAQGIPARTMGGCLSQTKRCTPVFSVMPYTEAKFVPMEEGDFKKRGFLHEYVEVYTPNEGWQLIEATAGVVYPSNCNTYLDYGYDSNPTDRCVINSQSFWSQCKVY